MRAFWLIPFALSPLFADGGAIQLQQPAGPFLVTIFAAPVPARVGPLDLSVLVQDRSSLDPVLDATVSVEIDNQSVSATHEQAQNKLLYAATVSIDQPGQQKFSVSVSKGPAKVTVNGALQAAPPPAKLRAFWSYLAIPPFAIALFAAHQFLKRQKGRSLSASGAGLGRDQLK